MSTYWLGVLTPFAVCAAGFVLFALWVKADDVLARHGFNFNLRWRRHVERISDFMLRHDIWWERQWGPVFAGGWYRDIGRINRWVGIGRPSGPCLYVSRSVDLTAGTKGDE